MLSHLLWLCNYEIYSTAGNLRSYIMSWEFIDHNNNNWFLYSAFLVWDTTQSALQCIITRGHWIQYQSCTHSAPSQLPGEHSGQALLQERTHSTSSNNKKFASYRIPIYTPGWRAGNVDKVSCWRTKGARHWRESNLQPSLIQSQGSNPIYHGTSTTHECCL